MTDTAAGMSDQCLHQINKPAGNLPRGHEFGGQHKKRNSQQGGMIDATENFLNQRNIRQRAIEQGFDRQYRNAEHQEHFKTQHQQQHSQRNNQHQHQTLSPASGAR